MFSQPCNVYRTNKKNLTKSLNMMMKSCKNLLYTVNFDSWQVLKTVL